MRKILLLAFCGLALACQQPKSTDETNQSVALSSASFDEVNYNFGKIKEGESVTHSFTFTNTGSAPLIITSATATCGCTVPEYPAQPIKPGEKGTIKVVFNSRGKMGKQDKVVTILSNAKPAMDNLHMIGEVVN